MTAVVHGFAPAAMMHMHGCAQVGRWVRQALLDPPTRRLRQPSFDPRGGLAGVWLAGQFASVIVGIHMQTYSFHAMAQRRRPQRPCVPTPCLDQRVRHGHDNPLVILGQNIKFMT